MGARDHKQGTLDATEENKKLKNEKQYGHTSCDTKTKTEPRGLFVSLGQKQKKGTYYSVEEIKEVEKPGTTPSRLQGT